MPKTKKQLKKRSNRAPSIKQVVEVLDEAQAQAQALASGNGLVGRGTPLSYEPTPTNITFYGVLDSVHEYTPQTKMNESLRTNTPPVSAISMKVDGYGRAVGAHRFEGGSTSGFVVVSVDRAALQLHAGRRYKVLIEELPEVMELSLNRGR